MPKGHPHAFLFPASRALRRGRAPTESWWATAPQVGFTRTATAHTQPPTSSDVVNRVAVRVPAEAPPRVE